MAQVHQFLTEVPRFLGFFEDSVLGSRCDGVRKASIVWRQVATDRGSESSAAKSVRGSRCGGSYEKSVRKYEQSFNPQPTARKSLFCTHVVLIS